MGETLKHFGIEERVLLDRKNFEVDLEDLQTEQVYHRIKPEELLSLNEQIGYILKAKHMDSQTKFT